jgi:cytochrome c-type biogenesis protein CcmH/NrfG
MQEGKYSEAIPIGEELLRLDERQPEVCYMLGWAYGREGDVPQALATVDRYASLLPPDDPAPVDQRGDVLRENGRSEEAPVE